MPSTAAPAHERCAPARTPVRRALPRTGTPRLRVERPDALAARGRWPPSGWPASRRRATQRGRHPRGRAAGCGGRLCRHVVGQKDHQVGGGRAGTDTAFPVDDPDPAVAEQAVTGRGHRARSAPAASAPVKRPPRSAGGEGRSTKGPEATRCRLGCQPPRRPWPAPPPPARPPVPHRGCGEEPRRCRRAGALASRRPGGARPRRPAVTGVLAGGPARSAAWQQWRRQLRQQDMVHGTVRHRKPATGDDRGGLAVAIHRLGGPDVG